MSKNKSKLNRSSILQDHKKVGKKYIPPLLQYKLQLVNWTHDLIPELLWLGLLCDQLGYRKTIQCALKLSQIINGAAGEGRKCAFSIASDYSTIDQQTRAKVVSNIDTDLRNELDSCIGLVSRFYPEFPMRWLVSDKWLKEASVGLEKLETIKEAIRSRIDRTSKPAMECEVLAYAMEGTSGRLKVSSKIAHDLNLISEYPNSDRSRRMGAHVRASLNALLIRRNYSPDWINYFWRHSFEISTCEWPSDYIDQQKDFAAAEKISPIHQKAESIVGKVADLGGKFENTGRDELKALYNSMKVDLANPIRHDVIIGLLARNLQLACDIAQNPGLWVLPISAILIRCMIETQIRLTWTIKSGNDKELRDYVEYGLGQEKLYVEHLKRISEQERPDKQEIIDDIKSRESWMNAQRFTFLQPVDVGGGTQGKDLRKLAEEAEIIDLHRLGFSPLSSYVHGHWNTIAKLNLAPCTNPLHGQHWLPILPRRPISLRFVFDAFNCYAECFELVSLNLTGSSSKSKAVNSCLSEMKELFEQGIE